MAMDAKHIIFSSLLGACLAACSGSEGGPDGPEEPIDEGTSDDDGPDGDEDADGEEQGLDAGPTVDAGDGDGDGGPDEPDGGGGLPFCPGVIHGEQSCSPCCIVDGDIIEWCMDVPCTACEQDGQVIEPGATAEFACNRCSCGRDGSIACTMRDCEVDCAADAAACPWRTQLIMDFAFDRGDGYGVFNSPISGIWVNTPTGEAYPDAAQRAELVEAAHTVEFRDFVYGGGASCRAIDGYWSQLRSERPPVETRGYLSLSLFPEDDPSALTYFTRVLPADCDVPELAPLSDVIDRHWGAGAAP